MRERDARVRRGSDRRRDAGHDLEGDARLDERERFLRAAREQQRIATFQTNDSAARPSEVDEIIQRLGVSGNEAVSPAMLKLPAPISLREALTSRLALAKPTRKILETLAAKASADGDKAKLAALLAPEAKDALPGYLEDREYVDLLTEFPSAKLTPQELVDHMRKLMPRLYSIASSSKPYPHEVHLTVAIVGKAAHAVNFSHPTELAAVIGAWLDQALDGIPLPDGVRVVSAR